MSDKPNGDDSWVMLLNITKDNGEKRGLTGINPRGEGAHLTDSARSYILRNYLNNDPEKLIGLVVLGQTIANTRPEFPNEKYFCFNVHRSATLAEFHDEAAACENDILDKSEADLIGRIKSKLAEHAPFTEEQQLAKVRELQPGVKMSDPNFSRLITQVEADREEELVQEARDIAGELIGKGPIPELIVEEAAKRIQLGSEAYWAPANSANRTSGKPKSSNGSTSEAVAADA